MPQKSMIVSSEGKKLYSLRDRGLWCSFDLLRLGRMETGDRKSIKGELKTPVGN